MGADRVSPSEMLKYLVLLFVVATVFGEPEPSAVADAAPKADADPWYYYGGYPYAHYGYYGYPYAHYWAGGREDPLNQSQLPMLTLRLTLTTTIEDIMDILIDMAFMDMEDIFGEGRGDQQSLMPSLQLMPRLIHIFFMEDTTD